MAKQDLITVNEQYVTPEEVTQTDLELFKKALRETGEKLTTEQLQNLYSCFGNFIDSYLDKEEQSIFGKTIDQLINQS